VKFCVEPKFMGMRLRKPTGPEELVATPVGIRVMSEFTGTVSCAPRPERCTAIHPMPRWSDPNCPQDHDRLAGASAGPVERQRRGTVDRAGRVGPGDGRRQATVAENFPTSAPPVPEMVKGPPSRNGGGIVTPETFMTPPNTPT